MRRVPYARVRGVHKGKEDASEIDQGGKGRRGGPYAPAVVRGKQEKGARSMLSPYRGRGFYDPRSEMNRLFDEMFGGLARQTGSRQGAQVSEWAPAIDVVQKDRDLVVHAEVPGAKPEDVEVTFHNGVLTIAGRREEQVQEERGGYLVRERRSGSFRRSLQLPEGVEEGKIHARFEDGVLEVTIQDAAAAREPKRIQVSGAESSGGRDVEVQDEGDQGTAEGGQSPGGSSGS